MTTRRYAYIFGGIIILAIILFFIFSKSEKTQEIYVQGKFGSFPIEVTTTGELQAKSSEKIYGPEGLRQIRVYQTKIEDIIPDGTVVDSGQYVATLDRTEITNKIKDEETNLEKYESQLIKTKLDTSLELRNARDELINLTYNLEEKKIALEQSKYEPPATIRQVEIDLEKGERALSQAEKNYKLRYAKAVATMNEVNAEYNTAQRKLDEMTKVLGQFTVMAPKSGMVIYRRSWDGSKMGIGATISAWDPVVAELPDLSKMISKTYVNEIDISKVKAGQMVEIGIDAFPDKKFTGTVTEVANIGEQLQGTNAKVFEVKILVNEFDSILRPSMTTKNTILTATIDSVLSIPLESVFNNDSITFVYKKDGSLVKQQVILGQSNYDEIIVKEGLNSEDKILLLPPETDEGIDIIMLAPEIVEKYNPKKDTVQNSDIPPKDSIKGGRMKMMEGGKKSNPGNRPSGDRQRRPGN
ncbi:MAG: efflux RND transporter periplasmic adaptor subunit [Bacteroidales bacterium]|nr:efflux RND transporter periplasmic adaptor subunit [Bacteroidales bacterium]